MDEVITARGGQETASVLINDMIQDQFGNYVLQTILDVATPEQRASIVAQLDTDALKNTRYGRHILTCIDNAGNSAAGGSQATGAAKRGRRRRGKRSGRRTRKP